MKLNIFAKTNCICETITTNLSAYDGMCLKVDLEQTGIHTGKKFKFASVATASTTWTTDSSSDIYTLQNVGIATTARSDSALYVEGTATITGDLNVTGDIVYDEVDGRNLNITGIATVGTLEVTNNATVGIITATQFVSNSTALPFYPPVMSTTQRDAMSVTQGAMIFNTTSKKMEFYDGTSWQTLPGMSLGLTVALDG